MVKMDISIRIAESFLSLNCVLVVADVAILKVDEREKKHNLPWALLLFFSSYQKKKKKQPVESSE